MYSASVKGKVATPGDDNAESESDPVDYSVFDFNDSEGKAPNKGIRPKFMRRANRKEDRATESSPSSSEDEEVITNDAEVITNNDAAAAGVDEDAVGVNEEPVVLDQPKDTPEAEADSSGYEKFREYILRSERNRCVLPPEMAAGAELMKMLNDKGGSLALYTDIFKWHCQHLKATTYVGPNKLHKGLVDRCDLDDTMPVEKPVTLPHSKVKLKLVCHDARAMLKDALSDPRITDEDYLFYDKDPLKGPPEEFKVLRDINTGLTYRETHARLIRPSPFTKNGRPKVLLPVIFYLDGCVTGQFNNLSLEILKFTLGIFNAGYRDRDCAWQNLGYVAHYLTEKSQAEAMLESSSHVDAKKYIAYDELTEDEALNFVVDTPDFDPTAYIDLDDPEANADGPQIPEIAAQDLHKILQVILASYKDVQDAGGFEWNLYYLKKIIEIHFIPFVLLIKGDGKEHDKHCGKYGSSTKNVQCLCRYCCIPNAETDQPYREPEDERKTQSMMERLTAAGDVEELKRMSQHRVWNAWYELRFGHKDGVHQSCPIEILHWILLGMYKYSRTCLFEQTGASSILSKNLNATCMNMGFLFQRQSDKEVPRTRFSRGVMAGKLMGHEMSGMMLVLASVLRCSRGRNLLLDTARGKQKDFFCDNSFITDWIMLIETQLQFEAWLCLPELQVKSVERAKTKVLELMGMSKQIAKREKGMRFNTMNFHGTKHVPDDLMNFGAHGNVNSRSNEMHHKRDKKTAMRTQKRQGNFDIQCGRKIQERRAVDYAIEEINGRAKWHYFKERVENETQPEVNTASLQLTGAKAEFIKNPEDEWCYTVHSSMKNKHKFRYEDEIVDVLVAFAEYAADHGLVLCTHTELKVNVTAEESKEVQTYRASPFYQGKAWNDWAMFDLSHQCASRSYVPCHLLCFVDFRDLPEENTLGYHPGIYAIINQTIKTDDGWEWSAMFKPYAKMTTEEERDGEPTRVATIDIVNVKHILEPTTLIPDLDNPNPRAYLRMIRRTEWTDLFEDWLFEEHTRDYDEAQTKPAAMPAATPKKKRHRKKNKGNSGKKKSKK